MRRFIRDVSSVLIITGVLLFLDAGLTIVWQEPVTAVIGMIQRGSINDRYVDRPLSAIDRHALASLPDPHQKIAFLAHELQREVSSGAALGQLVMPTLGEHYEIVQGTDSSSLEEGPGHYPSTSLPGLGKTIGIAGHRTTYLAPFRRLNDLHRGDEIVVDMPYGRFTYRVQYDRIVQPTALWVIDDVGYERLVLSACNPLYSASQRIVVFARLIDEAPTAEA